MNNSFDLIIWDTEEEIPLDSLDLIYWQSYESDKAKNITSITKLVEENADYYKSKYLSRVYEIGAQKLNGKSIVDHFEIRPGLSYWWLMLISEKSNYFKSPQIENIIKLEALHDLIARKNYKKIKLVTSNHELSDAVKLIASGFSIDFQCQYSVKDTDENHGIIRKIYYRLPYFIQSLVWLLNNSIFYWPLKGVGIDSWKNSEAKLTFATHFDNLHRGSHNSKYWTSLPDLLNKNMIKSNWLHIFQKDQFVNTPREAKKEIIKFNKSNFKTQAHVSLHSFLSIRLIINVLIDWLKIIRLSKAIKPHLRITSGFMWPLIKDDYFLSVMGPISISNLMELNLFEKAMGAISNQDRGCYLQENQPWEYSFIFSWRKNNHANNLLGVTHTAVKYWDLRYFSDPRNYSEKVKCSLPLPDNVGINGDAAKKMYINNGYSEKEIIEVEALRYLHLSNFKKHNRQRLNNKNTVVLVLGGYMKEDTKFLMDLLEATAQEMDKSIEFIVKPHPNCPIFQENYPNLSFQVSNEPIYELLNKCSMAYTSAVTSSAVDAYCAGKKVITAFNPINLNRSPLRGFNEVTFVSKSSELVQAIKKNTKLDEANLMEDSFFYTDSSLKRWKDFLSS